MAQATIIENSYLFAPVLFLYGELGKVKSTLLCVFETLLTMPCCKPLSLPLLTLPLQDHSLVLDIIPTSIVKVNSPPTYDLYSHVAIAITQFLVGFSVPIDRSKCC